MGRITMALAIAVALGLVGFGLVAASARPRPAAPHLVSMAESAQALLGDAGVMQAHGQAMLEIGQRTGNVELSARGAHWRNDGEQLIQRARWLTMDPLAPGSLVTPPAELSRQASWGELTRTAQAMLHDPSRARSAVDLRALKWNGEAMVAEGKNMVEHGRVMAEDVAAMASTHALDDETAAALRRAAATMQEVGGHLSENGRQMVAYADRLRQSLGFP